MILTEIQQQAIQARMAQIVGAENYDRLFIGVVFNEVADRILYAFAPTRPWQPTSRSDLRYIFRLLPGR